MIDLIALNALEKAINTYLRMDQHTIKRIAVLDKKIVFIQFKDYGIEFYIECSETGLRLFNEYERDADTSIRGTPLSLLTLACMDKPGVSSDVEISGDLHLGQEIRSILSEIDIDWEEYLSHSVGDVIASQVGEVFRDVFAWGDYVKDTMKQNLTEYLQEEIRVFPPREEMTDFLNDVDLLREDMERCAARIKKIEEKQ